MHAWGCASPCIIFVLFLWIGWSESAAPSFGCIGAGGTNVDFWFVYKFPRSAEYMYFDNSSIDWRFFPDLNNANSPLLKTTNEICPKKQEGHGTKIKWLSYNDQTGDCDTKKPATAEGYAHSKGIFANLGADSVWIMHSQPVFLCTAKGTHKTAKWWEYKNSLPDRAFEGPAQHYMCTSYKTPTFFTTAMQALMTERVYVDRSNFMSSHSIYVGTFKIAPSDEEFCRYKSAVVTENSFQALIHSKFGDPDPSPLPKKPPKGGWTYDNWEMVSQHLQAQGWIANRQKLWINTWRTGGKATIISADQRVSIVFGHGTRALTTVNPSKKLFWLSTADHSKWAIAAPIDPKVGQNDVVCVSGSNREDTQSKRGGETLCLKDKPGNTIIRKLRDALAKTAVFLYDYDTTGFPTAKAKVTPNFFPGSFFPSASVPAEFKWTYPNKPYTYTSEKNKNLWVGTGAWDTKRFLGSPFAGLKGVIPACTASDVPDDRKKKGRNVIVGESDSLLIDNLKVANATAAALRRRGTFFGDDDDLDDNVQQQRKNKKKRKPEREGSLRKMGKYAEHTSPYSSVVLDQSHAAHYFAPKTYEEASPSNPVVDNAMDVVYEEMVQYLSPQEIQDLCGADFKITDETPDCFGTYTRDGLCTVDDNGDMNCAS